MPKKEYEKSSVISYGTSDTHMLCYNTGIKLLYGWHTKG